MTSSPHIQTNTTALRETDPNVTQRRATNPSTSAWVSASAGTGKTKVLTDRVLRLLLPQENGAAGSNAAKILCLTFTKAAASEMAIRLSQTLSNWAVCNETELAKSLNQLLGRPAKASETTAARKLFAETIDVPGGLKIMTIHSFCQSILGRFPLEAGIALGFKPLEDSQIQTLIHQAKTKTIQTLKSKSDAKHTPTDTANALRTIAATINEDQFEDLLKSIFSERRQLQKILDTQFGIDGLYTTLCQALNIQTGQTQDSILRQTVTDTALNAPQLRAAARTLIDSKSEKDQTRGQTIASFLEKNVQARTQEFQTYKKIWLTDKNKIRQTLITKTAQKDNPNALNTLETEAERILQLDETLKATQCAALTRDLLLISTEILQTYNTLKAQQNSLDFDDLIIKTLDLLENKNNTASWVLYKLDQGIDHILVDEAQDTNPEQWQIIRALCDEFFAGENAYTAEIDRTLFIVGDEKQSIYSFQRASPEKFNKMHADFKEKIQNADKKWDDVPINISFRSTKSILQAVDTVFTTESLQKGVSQIKIEHIPAHNRSYQEGIVELWPLCEPNENDDTIDEHMKFWAPPTEIKQTKTGASKLCDQIADQIESWLKNKEILASHNRPIQPGDIMILVRTRNTLVQQIARALKNKNIPVGGADRLILGNEIIIQDLLAIAEFTLNPSDDLTLATILKSPILGLSEDDLFTLAHGRESTLWNALTSDPNHKDITKYLQTLINQSGTIKPYDFLTNILYKPCPANTISAQQAITKRLGLDATDPILELLSLALKFEQDHSGYLQQFVQHIRTDTIEIKREQEEAGHHVRIMTIHGSKGLQAPIVIMPDTIRSTSAGATKSNEKILWPDKTNLNTPLWAPRKDMECERFKTESQTIKQRAEEEYRRLLYVAMTRAEDRLYVCGHTGKTKPNEESWYFYIQQGLKAAGAAEQENGNLRLHNAQVREPDKEKQLENTKENKKTLPNWIFEQAPEEPHPPKILTPSRPATQEPAAASPLQKKDEYRFRRGNITHKLLEFIPNLPPGIRESTMQSFLQRHAADLSDKIQNSIILEIKNILNHPEFTEIFSKNAQSEVNITGLTPNGDIISGQIDRLLITDNKILIIDYKTNRPPPKNTQDVPQIYINQLKAYRDTLAQIYPNHIIQCALLWTDGPNLMPITFD